MNDKLFNLVEKMYIEFNGRFDKMHDEFNNRLDKMHDEFNGGFDGLEQRFGKMEIKLENDVSQKIEALFDGQKQMAEQLNRIEEKVDQHDEIIIKRIK